ncbi:MAG: CotH kinase family protein [Crocinitomicaceae bacterium]|tara:strand:- start:2527 stop:4377 length:1851 start_codon:yes stop_codon:yes gene_type:complete
MNIPTVFSFLFIACFGLHGQQLNDPQSLYDAPGGVFDVDSIRNLTLDFEDPSYHNILVNSFFNDPSYRIPATLTYNGVSYDSVGVRYKGNSTFCLPNDEGNRKVPYNIDMNHWISGQTLEDLKKIKLANAWFDPTFAKEITASRIYQKYLPTPEANLIRLIAQGNYVGIYAHTESVDKQFLKKHFDEKDGVFFKCDPVQVFCGGSSGEGNPDLKWLGADSANYYNSYDLKSNKGWGELMELIQTLNFDFENLGNVLNVDRVLWAFAVNSAILNLDTYNGYYVHNYYLYQTEDGLFQMIPWDFDNAFAGAILGYEYFNPSPVHNYDTYGGQYAANERPLLEKLLNDPLRRKQYNAHLKTILTETLLDTEEIRGGIDQLQDVAFASVQSDPNKLFSMTQFSTNVEEDLWTGWGFGGIMSMLDARNEYMSGLQTMVMPTPEISNMSLTNGQLTVDVDLASEVDVMATISPYNSKFQSFELFDDGTNGDLLANDNTYTGNLPFMGQGEAVKFYIRAQNSSNMKLLPERAEYEFFIFDENSGIDQSLTEQQLSIYPNPASTVLNVRGTQAQKLSCHVYTMMGTEVLRRDYWGTSASLQIAHLPAGAYVLRVNNQSFKLLKQ